MIELQNITKNYNISNAESILALNNISLTFKEGELIILKGASGSGKSTILSLIAGLQKPTSGEVIVDKKRISKLTDDFSSLYRRENIGFVFQKYNLIPNLSVKENIILPLIPNNIDENLLQTKLNKIMEKFNIEHKENILVKNLSGGEQQRVAIARAHINNPKIISLLNFFWSFCISCGFIVLFISNMINNFIIHMFYPSINNHLLFRCQILKFIQKNMKST